MVDRVAFVYTKQEFEAALQDVSAQWRQDLQQACSFSSSSIRCNVLGIITPGIAISTLCLHDQSFLPPPRKHTQLQAGDRLVVLEVVAEDICQTGYEEEAELHWKADKARALRPCSELKHVFQRTARECPDVVFLSAQVCVLLWMLGSHSRGNFMISRLARVRKLNLSNNHSENPLPHSNPFSSTWVGCKERHACGFL